MTFLPIQEQNESDAESLDVWGFQDSRFELNLQGQVYFTGSRYSLSGHTLPALIPWMESYMGITISRDDRHLSQYPPKIASARRHPRFLSELSRTFRPDQMTEEPRLRLRHGHGHSQEEMYAIKYGEIARIPDLVVYPESETDVLRLIEAAERHRVCLIPFGGGTSVSEALRCPLEEERTIVSVDMKRMNRLRWIDPVNRMASLEAGAVGREIARLLAERGFTLGHEPDSMEFSTLGGWIATHASGMKKNKYGNIEDIVLDLTIASSRGIVKRSSLSPRESSGIDPRLLAFGSEGTLGVITEAVVRICPLPEVQRYGSLIFPNFSAGLAFMYDLAHSGLVPASVRLVDNLQFQFSLALKPSTSRARAFKSRLEKLFVSKVLGMDAQSLVACTLLFEGTAAEVARQEKNTYRLAAKHKGFKGGAENGSRGYQLTFGIAYIRDFIMNYYLLAESFETSVPWSKAEALCDRVKKRVEAEHRARHLPGRPFVSCRVTQVYPTGVCIYFYLAIYYKGVKEPSRIFAEIEAAARDEILLSGGSLSHHHGIGKLRKKFLPRIMSAPTQHWLTSLKNAWDPGNIFGAQNQACAPRREERLS